MDHPFIAPDLLFLGLKITLRFHTLKVVICSNSIQGYPKGYQKRVHILGRGVPTFPTHKYPLVGFPFLTVFTVVFFPPFPNTSRVPIRH